MSNFRNRLFKSVLSNVLPIGFNRLDYIETNGTQYIDTVFKPNQDTRVVMDCIATSLSSNGTFFYGVRTGVNAGHYDAAIASPNNPFYGYGSNYTIGTSDIFNKRIVIDSNKNIASFTGSDFPESIEMPEQSFECTDTLALFVLKQGSEIYPNTYLKGKVYYCKIYDNGTLVRDYIPASDASGNEGMYDLANNTFYPLQTYFEPVVYDIPFDGWGHRMTLEAGTYKLQCWGAQGGVYSSSTMNRGGYSEGVLVLSESTMACIDVGGQPESVTSGDAGDYVEGGEVGSSIGYANGSGGSSRVVLKMYGQGGGGASSISLGVSSTISSDVSFNYAVIVAGAGAGAAGTSNSYEMHGGGETGGGGLHGNCGGTQINGGTCDIPGKFGIGIRGGYGISSGAFENVDYIASGAGGGWYGGGSNGDYMDFQGGSSTAMYDCGGGSGFVLTEETFANTPSTYKLTSKYFLKNAETIGGNVNIISPTGVTTKGHIGSGYVRITRIL